MQACIAILSWNAADKLGRAARSALAQTWGDIDVLVVDNGSTDGSRDLLPELEKLGCRIVSHDTNLGFAAGMNSGYEESDAEVFVPMNCDAVLHPEFIAEAIRVLEARPSAGVVGARVHRVDEHTLARPLSWNGSFPDDGFALGLRLSMRVRRLPSSVGERRAFKVNGACPVLRRDAVDDVRAHYGVGPFDPVFDTYGEDVDLAFKMWSRGWETVVSRAVVAAHERSYGERRRIYDRRGRLRVNSIAARHLNAWRHLPVSLLARSAPLLVAQDAALVARQLARADASVVADVRAAWVRAWNLHREVRRFRRDHGATPSRELEAIMNGSVA